MNKLFIVLLSLVLLAVPVYAQDGAKENIVTKIDRLAKELGDDDFDKREAATTGLIDICKHNPAAFRLIKDLHKTTKDAEVKVRTGFIINSVKPAKKEGSIDRSKDPKFKLPPEIEKLMPKGGAPDLEGLKGLSENKVFKKLLDSMMGGQDLDFGKILEQFMQRKTPRPQAPNLDKRKIVVIHESGVLTSKPNAALRHHVGLDAKELGVVLDKVVVGSYADRAGLKQFDIVIAIKGKLVLSVDGLNSLKSGAGELVVIRKGGRIKVSVPKWEAAKVLPSKSSKGF